MNIFVDDAVDYPQVNKFERLACGGTILNKRVLLGEVVEESRAIVATITVPGLAKDCPWAVDSLTSQSTG